MMDKVYEIIDSSVFFLFCAFFEAYSEETSDIFIGSSVASFTTNEWNGSSPAF